jgi:tRNA threonylcarbamoyladenosine biosynthesis protein TsaB
MRTIAIDTSHTAGSVVARDETALATRPLGAAGEHARRIAAALEEAAKEAGWRLSDAELVVVVRGPGSFTGLRVGVAAAKGIAWASAARLIGACGFEVVALETARAAARLAGRAPTTIEIAFDAGRAEVYAATATAMEGQSRWHISPPRLLAADAWIAELPPRSLVSGPALAATHDRAARAGHQIAEAEAWFPNATAASAIGLTRASAGDFDDPLTLVPHYLRLSYADERATLPER